MSSDTLSIDRIEGIRRLLVSLNRYPDATDAAKQLSRYYDAPDIKRMLESPPSKPVVLVVDRPNVDYSYISKMQAWSEPRVIQNNSIETVFLTSNSDIRLVLVSVDAESDQSQLDQIMMQLRGHFSGIVAVICEKMSTIDQAFHAGRCGCDTIIWPYQLIPYKAKMWLYDQRQAEKHSIGEDWLGLVIAHLHLKHSLGFTMFDTIASLNHMANE